MIGNRWAALAAVLLAAAVGVAVPASPALAHTALRTASPAATSTVTEPVDTVRLTFSGLVRKAGTEVAVTGPDGTSYSDGEATAVDKTVTQKVAPLPVGVIRVSWRTVSGDGHPIKGSYTFTNKVAPPVATTPPAPPTTAPATPPPSPSASVDPVAAAATSGEDGGGAGLAWAVGGGLAAVALLAGGVVWWRRRPAA